jgi:hypothetical protein
MLSLTSISALDAFLAGVARSISMYTRDIDFEFTLIEVMRYETPNQTVQHAHQRSIRPAISYFPDDALTRLSSLFDEDEFAALLSRWFTKHEHFLSVTLHEPQRGFDYQEDWYNAKRQMLIAVSEFIDGIVQYFGEVVEVYVYHIDPDIYRQLMESVLEEDRVLIFGREKAAILVLSMRQ